MSHQCNLEMLKTDGSVPTINLFKQKRTKGWWPFSAKNDDNEIMLQAGTLNAENFNNIGKFTGQGWGWAHIANSGGGRNESRWYWQRRSKWPGEANQARLQLHVVPEPPEVHPPHHLAQSQVDHRQDHPRHSAGHLPPSLLLLHPWLHSQEHPRRIIPRIRFVNISSVLYLFQSFLAVIMSKCIYLNLLISPCPCPILIGGWTGTYHIQK